MKAKINEVQATIIFEWTCKRCRETRYEWEPVVVGQLVYCHECDERSAITSIDRHALTPTPTPHYPR